MCGEGLKGLIVSDMADSQRQVIGSDTFFIFPNMTFWPWHPCAQNPLAGDEMPLRNSEFRHIWKYYHPEPQKKNISSEFRHIRACANRNIKEVFWGLTLVSSHTRDRAQEVRNTLIVKSADKELKATVQCQVHVTTEGPVAPAESQFPRCCQFQDCYRIVGTNDAPRGDACRNQGRTGHT